MTPMLILLGLLSCLELLLYLHPLWHIRRVLAAGLAVSLSLVSGGLFGVRPSVALGLLAIVSLYRVVNLLRLVHGASDPHYLRQVGARSSWTLIGVQLFLLCIYLISNAWQPPILASWYALGLLQVIACLTLLFTTRRQLHHTAPAAELHNYSDSQLPSLSVCIPARNETADLEACLHSLTASDYPKLEILVLDDCSPSGRTSDIIRSFAHDGVRFLGGTPPADTWLAKNWAYQQLLNASSGRFVLFCGVDTRFDTHSLRQLVGVLQTKRKRMASFVPRNELPTGLRQQFGLLIQPARYAWEFCLPRRRLQRPPVLSTCWLAERRLISSAGGFAAVSGSIAPEAYFARRAIATDSYSFLQATAEMSVESRKSATEQWATAIRTRYPQLHKRPEVVMAVSLVELALLAGPLVLVIGALIATQFVLAGIALGALIVVSWVYGAIVAVTYRQRLLRGFWLAVPAVLLDVYIRHESMWRYEFGEVNWKGRNVCLPVMRVIPRLPQL